MLLKTDEITIRFGGLTAVNAVCIRIEPGQIVGLIGPNGAGKTTCFNIISGVYKPTSGKVYFEDRDITGQRPFKLNALGISRTYQAIRLFKKMSVSENVLVGMHDRFRTDLAGAVLRTRRQREEERDAKEKARGLLAFVGLESKADFLSSNLSYGEQRLLEIVRAMASSPKLLLLDEPAAGMNTSEKQQLMATINAIRDRGFTVLIVEHDMRVIMGITDYIYVLNYGKLIAEGDPASIQNNPEVIAAYLGG